MWRFKVLFESSILTEMSGEEYDGDINHVDGAAKPKQQKGSRTCSEITIGPVGLRHT